MEHQDRSSLESLLALADKCKNEPDDLKALWYAVESIADYQRAIIRESSYYALFAEASGDQRNFMEEYHALDESRTSAHNAMINNVAILNKLAGIYGLPAFYDGPLRFEQPFRRRIADAALLLLEEIVKSRL
jgi:hypothetical protein